MNRWLHIIVSLFLALGVATMPMAHAAELSFGTGTVASVDSFPGFSKKSNDKQSDPAKASVNLHGCHGHHIGIPVDASPTPELVIAVKAVTARNGDSIEKTGQARGRARGCMYVEIWVVNV